jgi:predicted nucleic acid-binding protein
MPVLADTSVWSLAYRRDTPGDHPEVAALKAFLVRGDVVSTGLIYLELLRGFTSPDSRMVLESDFDAVPFLAPRRRDYAGAADLATKCRAHGVQLATIDALIAQLAIAYDVQLLTTDSDFSHAAKHIPLDVWRP